MKYIILYKYTLIKQNYISEGYKVVDTVEEVEEFVNDIQKNAEPYSDDVHVHELGKELKSKTVKTWA